MGRVGDDRMQVLCRERAGGAARNPARAERRDLQGRYAIGTVRAWGIQVAVLLEKFAVAVGLERDDRLPVAFHDFAIRDLSKHRCWDLDLVGMSETNAVVDELG